MPTKLSTITSKIACIPNRTDTTIVEEFHKYMKENDSSERHQNNALKFVIAYIKFLGSDMLSMTLSINSGLQVLLTQR
ncbi:MAG: hypothetical protein ACJ719_09170 [Nitrososphaeraceae archaeon]